MAELVTKFKVFLASPSDLSEDRDSIDEVINELNQTYGSQNNIVIELIKWETHSAPGVSLIDQQDLINQDINDDYDLFIGLMWLRFGTPTSKADSGTEEEFDRAYNRFNESPNSLQILFYFKSTPPLNLQDIVPSELEKVNAFKNRLGEEGTLYWHYGSVEELHGYLRLHIPKRLSNLKSTKESKSKKHDTTEKDSIEILDDDLGLLDYIEISEERFATSTNAVNKIAEATEWIGSKMTEKADEINKINNSHLPPNQSQLKRILKLTAQAMNEYASRIRVEIPIFFENYEEGIKAFSSIVNLADDFFDRDNIDELVSSREDIIHMNDGINNGLSGMIGFFESVNDLPRIDKEINKAKRNLTEKLGRLINDMKASSVLATELVSEISEKINRIELTITPNAKGT